MARDRREMCPVVVVVADGADIYMVARKAAALGMAVERILPVARILNGYCDTAILTNLRGVHGIESADEARVYTSRALN